MGTNYYAESAACEHCGRTDDRWHVMKSFHTFQGFTEDDPTPWGPIRSWQDWDRVITANRLRIFDEYGREHPRQEILDEVAAIPVDRRRAQFDRSVESHGTGQTYNRLDPDGYTFSDAWFS